MQLTEYINAGFIFAERFGSPESIPELSRKGFIVNSRPQVQSDGLVFDGLDDYIRLNSLGLKEVIDVNNNYSVVIRVKILEFKDYGIIFSFTKSTANLFGIMTRTGGIIAGGHWNGGSYFQKSFSGLVLNTSYIIAFTHSSSNTNILYVDGVVGSGSDGLSLGVVGNISIADYSGGISKHGNQNMSHLLFINRILSPDEIQQISNDLA